MLHAFLCYCLFLGATIALEAPVALMLAHKPQRRRALTVCIAANLFTHPFATLLSWQYVDVIVVEALVILLEAACYLRIVPLAPVRAFALSLTANVLTGMAGLVFWLLTNT